MRNKQAHLLIILIISTISSNTYAQADSLHFSFEGAEHSEHISYDTRSDSAEFTLVGRFDFGDSAVAVTIPYKRGKESGVYRAFYPNGKLMIFAVYGWGQLHGDWTEYDEYGDIILKGQFRDGKRHGTWYTKALGLRAHYRKGLKHGSWKYYEEGVLVRKEKYRRGSLRKGGTFLFKKR